MIRNLFMNFVVDTSNFLSTPLHAIRWGLVNQQKNWFCVISRCNKPYKKGAATCYKHGTFRAMVSFGSKVFCTIYNFILSTTS